VALGCVLGPRLGSRRAEGLVLVENIMKNQYMVRWKKRKRYSSRPMLWEITGPVECSCMENAGIITRPDSGIWEIGAMIIDPYDSAWYAIYREAYGTAAIAASKA
jgi:hypothetical protein